MDNTQKRNTFKGSLGFVLAAAGSAVGLGNIWRFPYLATRDGGGMFLVMYLILALTFGFTLLATEIAIGRKTKKSPLTAYGELHKRWKALGVFACIIPAMILPYYCVIGGWVIKYLLGFAVGQGAEAAGEGYFSGFISGTAEPMIMTGLFLAAVGFVVIRGVNKGIESFSRILMPLLLLLVVLIAVFSLTLSHTEESGVTRTGMEGLLIYLIPDFKNITAGKFLTVLIDAMGQLFFSLSVAMGIMVTYGSYARDDEDLNASVNHIELFDTVIAFLAGVMIIPAVYVFSGREGMAASGPGLMFVSLPRVFDQMGKIGGIVGTLFFAMVFFAALTSAISIMEAVVSCMMDRFSLGRTRSVLLVVAGGCGAGVCSMSGIQFAVF